MFTQSNTRERCGALRNFRKIVLGNMLQVAAGERDQFTITSAMQSELPRDAAGGERVVAGDHFHLDARLLALFHRDNRLGARRMCGMRVGGDHPGFFRGGDERGLGGIALHLEPSIGADGSCARRPCIGKPLLDFCREGIDHLARAIDRS